MANIVLVPGGWRGGWTYAAVARRLRAQGHQVFAATLTGLGERVHLAHACPNLETHIEDVANLIRFEDLSDVILCGHSYAGFVISGVADRLSARISALVYIDAFVPGDGDSWWDLAGEHYRKIALDGARADGRSVMPPTYPDPRCTPHPLAAFCQSIVLSGRWKEVKEKIFIYAAGWAGTPFTATYEALREDPAWSVATLPCGHNVIVEAPDQFIALVANAKAARCVPLVAGD